VKILHLSDTHRQQNKINIPSDIDIIIHSGDFSNKKDSLRNEKEALAFIDWFSSLDIKYKVLVAGNHDTSIQARLITPEQIENRGIIYLENASVKIEGLLVWGSPYTPLYGEWAFMAEEDRLALMWETIPDDADIVITHGPPLGMLDMTFDSIINDTPHYRLCGSKSLADRMDKIQPTLHCFGHIHNSQKGTGVFNAGTRLKAGSKTIYSNGSCSTDGLWGEITSHGNIIEITI
jgi:Icc-related predicted phosphoesterase